ncbi:hypothetical protein GCM10018954_013330 [Kutzneria kofuensis]
MEVCDAQGGFAGIDAGAGRRLRHLRRGERAVDSLSDQSFPVQHTTISGVGLRLVEDVLGG